jgi:hypothetical protein
LLLATPFDIDLTDIKLLEALMQWLKRLREEEGLSLENLQTACEAMIRIAQSDDCEELMVRLHLPVSAAFGMSKILRLSN